jgi:hypothetical protein
LGYTVEYIDTEREQIKRSLRSVTDKERKQREKKLEGKYMIYCIERDLRNKKER